MRWKVISKARLSLRRRERLKYKMCWSPAIFVRTNWDWHKRIHHVREGPLTTLKPYAMQTLLSTYFTARLKSC